jgi:hypothetical protein
MDGMNPVLLVSLTCCIGPLLFGGTCFAVGRWSTRWRLTLNRQGSAAEAQIHSETVGYGTAASLPPQEPPLLTAEQRRQRKLQRRVQQGQRASSTRTVNPE